MELVQGILCWSSRHGAKDRHGPVEKTGATYEPTMHMHGRPFQNNACAERARVSLTWIAFGTLTLSVGIW